MEKRENEVSEIVRIKALRQSIDSIIQKVKNLKSCKETSICIIKLQEAVMWHGFKTT